MRKRVSSLFVISAVCAALGVVVFAGGAQAAVRHFDATVLSKSSAAKTVQVRTESGAKLTFKVNARTKFERIGGGFSGLTKGLAVGIDANNASGQWVATQIEAASGNSGGGGPGGHGGGHDDGPNHT
ncbi:MAG: DUF5666 domain-containing protein [Solirubrobacterales bacterium]